MNIHIALAGNPNSGKTTLFNRLTGMRQTTGNWPGVTVEKKIGIACHGPHRITIVDLPGIYSLSPGSLEEIVTRNYILEDQPDVLVNIVDATNLERNLFFTLQLRKLGRPMLIALNMMDEISSSGDKLDIPRLSERLGLPVVPISARKSEGIGKLLQSIEALAASDTRQQKEHHHILTEQPFGGTQEPEAELQPGRRRRRRFRFGAGCSRCGSYGSDSGNGGRYSCGSGSYRRGACGSCPELSHCPPWVKDAEHDHTREQPATLAVLPADFSPEKDAETKELFQEAAAICAEVLIHKQTAEAPTRSERIDRFLTHRWLAFPIFLLVMFIVFQITFHEQLGGRITGWIDKFFSEIVSKLLEQGLTAIQAPAWVLSLLIDGIVAGVGGVLTFLPQIALLFLFLSILEDTGYMARAAFITDRIFQSFGLSGRSFIPMLMGFGCTVPAIMAARSLESERDRRLTIMITPFMSCGARMPIYGFFASLFFVANKGLVIFSMYLLGILVAILSALLLSKTVLRGKESSFVIELPPYRLPDLKSLSLHIWDKIRDFIVRAGTLIFAMTVVIWFLQTFSLSLRTVTDSSQSILGQFGSLIAPLLQPLGFGNWQSSVTLLTGLIAKEAVVASIEILFVPGQLLTLFSPLTAYAFMTFALLYTPCIATLGAIRRELNSWRWTLLTVSYQIGVAYLAALAIYQGGRLLGL